MALTIVALFIGLVNFILFVVLANFSLKLADRIKEQERQSLLAKQQADVANSKKGLVDL